jgi:hypothetical protein
MKMLKAANSDFKIILEKYGMVPKNVRDKN